MRHPRLLAACVLAFVPFLAFAAVDDSRLDAKTVATLRARLAPNAATNTPAMPAITRDGVESRVETVGGAFEPAVAVSPGDSAHVIAMVSNPGRDELIWLSDDGGESWRPGGVLPQTAQICCKPSLAWSYDGSRAYALALGMPDGDSPRVWLYTSTDYGATWSGPVLVGYSYGSAATLHVDSTLTSPRRDTVYVAWLHNERMNIARSTNQGQSFEMQQAIDYPDYGFGIDLATDLAGRLYYVYAPVTHANSHNGRSIRVLRSDDGGDTFQPGVTIASTNASGGYLIPAADVQGARVIPRLAIDRSPSPFAGSVYVTWSDKTSLGGGAPNTQHGVVRLARSRDLGATWSVVTPHEIGDGDRVDRFAPDVAVDPAGTVHLVFYDTRDAGVLRNGVDLYATTSFTGGESFGTPRRLSGATSPRIRALPQWGDYLSFDSQNVTGVAVFTDNRAATAASDAVTVYGVSRFIEVSEPAMQLTLEPSHVDACRAQPMPGVGVGVRGIGRVTDTARLGATSDDGAIEGLVFDRESFDLADAPLTAVLDGRVAALATPGPHDVVITGLHLASGETAVPVRLRVDVADGAPPAPTALAPASGETIATPKVRLRWSPVPGALAYVIEVANDPAFESVIERAEVSADVLQRDLSASLSWNGQFYWRVAAHNVCGDGAFSAPVEFFTANAVCSTEPQAIPDNERDVLVSGVTVLGGEPNARAVRVVVEVEHSFVGDLRFDLARTGFNDPPVSLMHNARQEATDACAGRDLRVLFDDAAPTFAQAACADSNPALDGRYRPLDPLSSFDGQPSAGEWTLRVFDSVFRDAGTLTRWCLILPSRPRAEAVFKDGFEDAAARR